MSAVENAFGWNGVNYAMLVKLYGPAIEGTTRYSPPQLHQHRKAVGMGSRKRILFRPATRSHRTPACGRTSVGLTRLTNGHSKKLDNHVHAMSLRVMYYNFRRPHMTLAEKNGGIKQTPEMAAGVADHVWMLDAVVALLPE